MYGVAALQPVPFMPAKQSIRRMVEAAMQPAELCARLRYSRLVFLIRLAVVSLVESMSNGQE